MLVDSKGGGLAQIGRFYSPPHTLGPVGATTWGRTLERGAFENTLTASLREIWDREPSQILVASELHLTSRDI